MDNKRNDIVVLLLIATSWISIWSCASSGTLRGGPKDVKPPKLDTLTSTANKQTNFKPKEMTFYFDEFVEVKDAIKQVLVSPPLTYIPKVQNKGKKVTFTFDDKEVLREAATYTINFGDAIVDFHESNKLQNFTFVFATGDVLDSLSVKGNIKNALTNDPEKEMVVFLYDNTQDSVVAKEKPFYFAKTDKDGNFTFTNIKSDTFKLFALQDENLNYIYDLDIEKIAFWDSLVILDESLDTSFQLVASLPTPYTKILSSTTKTYGKVNILLNTSTPNMTYTVSDTSVLHYKESVGDTINIHYKTEADSFYVYMLDDTIKVRPRGKEDFIKKTKFVRNFANHTSVKLPTDSLILGFNLPIGSVNFDLLTISDTIGALDNVVFSYSEDNKKIIAKYNWVGGEKYQIICDSAGVTSIHGQVVDSFGLDFVILKPEQTASMELTIVDLDSTLTYVINIKKDGNIMLTTTAEMASSSNIYLKGVVPERYDIEIIQDTNKNGRWDPGNYWTKSQPEKFKLIKGDKLKENWDSEFSVSWKIGTIGPSNEPINSQSGLPNNIIEQKRKN